MCNGERYVKACGIVSGSYFTQLVGSIVNYIILRWTCRSHGIHSPFIRVLGDDSILATDCELELEWFLNSARRLGMAINLRKSVVTENVDELSFLSYNIGRGEPKKSRFAWITALMFPEGPDKDWYF